MAAPLARGSARGRSAGSSAREEARGAFRQAILAAAERVFARSGFYAARMADVAREAGVGVGTLYNYFDSKEAIFSDLMASRHEAFVAAIRAAATSEDPVERLRQVVRRVLALLDENGALMAVFRERGAVGEYDVERLLGESADRSYGETLALFEKAVRAAVRARRMRSDVEPRLLVSVLSGALNGAIYDWLKRGRRGRLADTADVLFDVFLEGARSQ